MRKPPKESLLEQARHELKQKSGGGILRYEVWGYVESGKTFVTRYNMAYINQAVCSKTMVECWATTMHTAITIGTTWGRVKLVIM